MIRANKIRPLGFFAALAASAALLLAAAASASAAAPAWRIDTLADTTAAPGGQLTYLVEMRNVGDANTDSQIELFVTLPAGLRGVEAGAESPFACSAGDGVSPVAEASTIKCVGSPELGPGATRSLPVTVRVNPGAPIVLTSSFAVSGGGAAQAATAIDPTRIAADPPGFGIDAFDGLMAADPAGTPYTQAAGHPYDLSTSVDLNTVEDQVLDESVPNTGVAAPAEPVRDIVADVPPGVLGDPTVASACTANLLANGKGLGSAPLCPVDSQVGIILLRARFTGLFLGPVPVYNMQPPPGVAARFGFAVAGTVQTVDAQLRADGSYGLAVGSHYISEGISLDGFTIDLWGVPGDPSHDSERACPGSEKGFSEGGPTCASPNPTDPLPFLRNTTSCTDPGEGLLWSIHADSWFHRGATLPEGYPELGDANWKSAAYRSHEAPGYPANPEDPSTPWGAQIGVDDCEATPFEPEMEVQPTTNEADAPSGLEVDIEVPQQECWEEASAICQSDLKKAVVKLPQGMTINPAEASGLEACTSSEIGLLGTEFQGINPIHFTGTPAACPESSKIGGVRIDTPLLDHPVDGAVYLAKQGDNPFKSLLALYIVAEDPQSGVILKLPGAVIANSETGQLEAIFDANPQLPFSHFHVELKSGPRAPLITPPACGKYATVAGLSPWARPEEPVELESQFELTVGPGGGACPAKPAAFSPELSAGTTNPLAGSYSPFTLRLTRQDGTQRLSGLDLTLPPGLAAKFAGIPYCPDAALGSIPTAEGTAAAQLASPSCPPASQVGTVSAGAGAGVNPFYVSGKAYLAGPYKGAPLSLAIVTPALAGPFDLGNVLVRSALFVDPTTAQGRAVSDPLPQILDGIPLDLRDVRVNLDRNQFTLNPTNCEEMSVAGTVTGTEGGSANVSSRFQVGSCERLGFKPKLSLRLKGKTSRGANPALRATLTMPPGGANIAKAQVTLPHSEFLDQAHIRTICTRVQFAANACPKASIYGHARAITPLLDQPLEGPVYLRSSSHPLPDLVADLNGQIHVVLDGRIDSVKGGIRNTFDIVPDAPVSKFVLTMQGGKKGLLQNGTNLCAATHRATVLFDGQNGKTSDSTPALKAVGCDGKAHRKRSHGHR